MVIILPRPDHTRFLNLMLDLLYIICLSRVHYREDRKGWDILLSAFFSEFSRSESVILYIQTYLYGEKFDARNEGKILDIIERHALKHLSEYKVEKKDNNNGKDNGYLFHYRLLIYRSLPKFLNRLFISYTFIQ